MQVRRGNNRDIPGGIRRNAAVSLHLPAPRSRIPSGCIPPPIGGRPIGACTGTGPAFLIPSPGNTRNGGVTGECAIPYCTWYLSRAAVNQRSGYP
jgi:hypothetical protein